MSRAWEAELAEYVLGHLADEPRRQLEAALLTSPELRTELQQLRELFGLLGERAAPLAPPEDALGKLLRSLDTSARFSPFVGDLARHLDLPEARVRELLRQTDDLANWNNPVPYYRFLDFDPGPQAAAPHAGFVWLARGTHIPYHRHKGNEIVYILQGALRNDDGAVYAPGDALVLGPGSEHEFWVLDDADLLYAIAHESYDFIPKPD